MRIDGPPLTPADAAREDERPPTATTVTAPVSTATPGAGHAEQAVVVSRTALDLVERAGKERTSRSERVATLREAVASGRYRVDLDRLAERFVDEEMDPRNRR